MSARAFSILDAIGDERLFGRRSGRSTWQAWLCSSLVCLRCRCRSEAGLWRACTGRCALPTAFPREVAGLRQAERQVVRDGAGRGLSRLFPRLSAVPWSGREGTLMVVAADRQQARVVLRFVRGLLAAPVLAKRVVNDIPTALSLRATW